MNPAVSDRVVEIPAAGVRLHADLNVPPRPQGVVIFAHGSGSSRVSKRNRRPDLANHLVRALSE